jgi:hypothetical protein
MVVATVLSLLVSTCNKEVVPRDILTGDFTVLAWNDLGMHCLNPTYDEAVILPPYNTVWAQVVERGNPPRIVTEDVTVQYRVVDNTYSSGKTDELGGVFAQFWENVNALFGADLDTDTGLNLDDPEVHNGLSGTMLAKGDHFQVSGVPLTPVDDSGTWNPYQVVEVTVKNAAGTVLATTRTTIPTSDEIDCARCHAQDGPATVSIGGGQASALHNVLASHDALHATNLVDSKPVLCASCHATPALGTPSPASPSRYLSASIHGSHATRSAACYDCHPGASTSCNRSEAHTADNGNCTACHLGMSEVASSIVSDSRIPWVTEPKCASCHTGVQDVDTGAVLYRNATGHGGMYCAACHGSPHAMVPSLQQTDNAQFVQYQSTAVSLGSCAVCHESSHGEDLEEFGETHAGPGGRTTSCKVCHTEVHAIVSSWPHAFTWKAR